MTSGKQMLCRTVKVELHRCKAILCQKHVCDLWRILSVKPRQRTVKRDRRRQNNQTSKDDHTDQPNQKLHKVKKRDGMATVPQTRHNTKKG